jgi:hypothetical protein
MHKTSSQQRNQSENIITRCDERCPIRFPMESCNLLLLAIPITIRLQYAISTEVQFDLTMITMMEHAFHYPGVNYAFAPAEKEMMMEF